MSDQIIVSTQYGYAELAHHCRWGNGDESYDMLGGDFALHGFDRERDGRGIAANQAVGGFGTAKVPVRSYYRGTEFGGKPDVFPKGPDLVLDED